jgi:hypothetical protein
MAKPIEPPKPRLATSGEEALLSEAVVVTAWTGDWLGTEVLDLPILRDRLLRHGFMSLSMSAYDIDRFGAAAALHAAPGRPLMVIGTVTMQAPILKRVYDQMAEPKWVMAFGACLDGRLLRQLRHVAGHRPRRPRRHLHAGVPAAARGRARRAHGPAEVALEAAARRAAGVDVSVGSMSSTFSFAAVIPDLRKLDVYRRHGGYEMAKKALTSLTPEHLIDMVKASNLRGRGGAGFPPG